MIGQIWLGKSGGENYLMDIDGLDPFHDIKVVALPVPSSFKALPKLPRLNKKQLNVTTELERSFTQESGILPGTYTNFDDVQALLKVHDRLWDRLRPITGGNSI